MKPFLQLWLVDFVNKFGDLGGFDALLARFQSSENKLTISLVVALLKPWGPAYQFLTPAVIKKYFAPIIVSEEKTRHRVEISSV